VGGDTARWGDLVVGGDARRQEVRRRHSNGLDTVEVDRGGRRLILTFLEHAPVDVGPANVRIDGPVGAPPVAASGVRRGGEDDPRLADRLVVFLTGTGGKGRYTLRLVEATADGQPGWAPLRHLDPHFAEVALVFDVDLPNHVTGAAAVGARGGTETQASYLARDYQGFRQLIFDRMAETLPAWTERHAADIGVTLVELLAYVGDDLSYYQDAVATEAYLQTARQRISVRRHARLVDYRLGEGRQSRAWVCLHVSDAVDLPLRGVVFAAAPGLPEGASPVLSPGAVTSAAWGPIRRFTPVRVTLGPSGAAGVDDGRGGPSVTLIPAHNEVALWSWGESDSRLAAGATSAVLVDPVDMGASGRRSLNLHAGDVVVFEAIVDASGIGPPDPTQRHPVRLTEVHASVDRLYDQPIVEVTWSAADALPFDLQVSVPGAGGVAIRCAVLRANTVLVGDGHATTGQLPAEKPAIQPGDAAGAAGAAPGGPVVGDARRFGHGQPAGQPARRTPTPLVLTEGPLTWACPFPDPTLVARHQAQQLRLLPRRWRRQVDRWRRHAQAGEALNEAQLGRLRSLLGSDTLTDFDLGDDPPHDSYGDAESLRRLLQEADRLLAPRVRRLRTLAVLAEASGPLPPVLIRELADDWGPELVETLNAHHPAACGPAAAATAGAQSAVLPLLSVAPAASVEGDQPAWTVVADVVDSRPGSRHVMVEVDDDGRGHLRFSPGDEPTGAVEARFQVGQGVAGNVAAGAINAIEILSPGAAGLPAVRAVTNPMAAVGGADPETITAAKAAVPGAFLIDQPRALVADDYSRIAARVEGVRRAATVIRWTGTRRAAAVAIQPARGEDPDADLLAAVHHALWPLRRIGHELWVGPPRYRPLVVAVNVDIGADAVRAEVNAELQALIGSGRRSDGSAAMFNPERLGFGQTIYASAIVAAAQHVAGVEAVVLTRFEFLATPRPHSAARPPPQLLRLQPNEIARLDNDPVAPQHGYVIINLRGGR
jgi:predicted phage baseplate assembly protein